MSMACSAVIMAFFDLAFPISPPMVMQAVIFSGVSLGAGVLFAGSFEEIGMFGTPRAQTQNNTNDRLQWE